MSPSVHTEPTKHMTRIAIVGAGQVGSALAYSLILGNIANELILVDTKAHLRDGQVSDLSDVVCSGNGGTRIRSGTYHDAGQCDLIVVTAGSRYGIGETSVQHMYRKVSILRSVVTAMRPFRPDAILLIVSNPVDLLTSLAQELSGLPLTQVLGSGTLLDSVRLRGLLAENTGVCFPIPEMKLKTWANWANLTSTGCPQFNRSLRRRCSW